MPRVYPPIDGKTSSAHLPPSLVEVAAGFSAGVVSTLAVHPFDVVKTRLQVDQSKTTQIGGSVRIARSIVENDGFIKGLYRGLSPNIIGNSVSWALYFMWYGNIKDVIQSYRGQDAKLRSLDYFVASGASGILTAFLTNPIWVIKTRMLSTGSGAPGAYAGVADGARRLYRAEGIAGFYRGLVPSLFGVSHGAVQFMAYEQLKNWRTAAKARAAPGAPRDLGNWDFLALSAVSKIFAGSITYPYQVVRARLQVYDAGARYAGARDVVAKVWRGEGLAGFYKGLGPNIVRVLPSTCVTFLVYENTKHHLPRLFAAPGDGATKSEPAA